jgi:23S rRNA pseudouridine2605 synthase
MATKKTTTKTAKPVALKITPIDPESEPKRKRKSATAAPKAVPTAKIEDPLGEPADGEGKTYLGDETTLKASSETASSSSAEQVVDEVKPGPVANDEAPEDAERPFSEAWVADDSPAAEEIAAQSTESEEESEDESEAALEKRPPAKLERLQKILSQAGIASRRKAEQMIEEGRVQVNGTTITELGTKADAGRDHIRVDGKLLHGAERHRYFVLNKPRGFVTTVKDPEGRPTVMTFFEKMRERLYPVGRLDYMSEGLLLVTNDGDLANRLTKAGSGVEKTYYVKVAGQPTEEELDRLRGGVMIERGQPGSDRVRTSPARIRQVRQGDNPWYEVVLIEGRNRELRKMFSSIGHFVEKIRRVGYGPLILDVEPGKLRELDPQELEKLKLASEGKLRTPKAKDIRRRDREDAGTYVQPKRVNIRPSYGEQRQTDSRPSRPSGANSGRSSIGRYESRRPESGGYEPRRSDPGGPRPGGPRPSGGRPSRPFAAGDRGARPNAGRPDVGRSGAGRPDSGRPGEFRPKPQFGASKPYQDAKPFQGDRPGRPAFRPAGEGGYRSRPATGGRSETKPFRSGAEKGRWKNAEGERPRSARTGREQSSDRPRREGVGFDKPRFDKPRYDKAKPGGPAQRSFGAPARNDRPSSDRPRPTRANGEFKRPFTPRGDAPRAGGARPAGKPFRPGGQGDSRPTFRTGPRPASGARPATGSRPTTGSGSRPSYGAGSRPASGGPPSRSGGGSSRPPSRGFGKPGEKKTGFQNRGGARSSGRPGGKRRP